MARAGEWLARLSWWAPVDDPEGNLEACFSPAPPKYDWWETVSDKALGHVTVITREHDDATGDAWIILDCDTIDKAVQAHLEAEEQADRAKKTHEMFGGGRPWYGPQKKRTKETKRKLSLKPAKDKKRVKTGGVSENVKGRDSAKSATNVPIRKKRKAAIRLGSSDDDSESQNQS